MCRVGRLQPRALHTPTRSLQAHARVTVQVMGVQWTHVHGRVCERHVFVHLSSELRERTKNNPIGVLGGRHYRHIENS